MKSSSSHKRAIQYRYRPILVFMYLYHIHSLPMPPHFNLEVYPKIKFFLPSPSKMAYGWFLIYLCLMAFTTVMFSERNQILKIFIESNNKELIDGSFEGVRLCYRTMHSIHFFEIIKNACIAKDIEIRLSYPLFAVL